MKKMLGVLVGLALVVGTELWGLDSAGAQAKPPVYMVCAVNLSSGTGTLVSELSTTKPVELMVSTTGPMSTVFYAVFETTVPTTCAALVTDMGQPGPYPAGINLEAETTHKPVLK
jgi:hypothetical protein